MIYEEVLSLQARQPKLYDLDSNNTLIKLKVNLVLKLLDQIHAPQKHIQLGEYNGI
jgi:hypothetical protein